MAVLNFDGNMSVEGQYDDIIDLLHRHGYNAGIMDTGGGCLAIEIPLDTGRTLIITDKQGPLDNRDELRGWGIGLLNETGGFEDSEYREVSNSSPEALLAGLKAYNR